MFPAVHSQSCEPNDDQFPSNIGFPLEPKTGFPFSSKRSTTGGIESYYNNGSKNEITGFISPFKIEDFRIREWSFVTSKPAPV